MRARARVAAASALAVIAVGVAIVALATTSDLPWQSRLPEVAHDGTSEPVGTSPSPAAAAAVRFLVAFPHLPPMDRMTNLVELPGARRMIVTLQEGEILSFENDSAASTTSTVLDWRSRTSTAGNEEGLLGFALDPQFTTNSYLYIYYSAAGGARRTVLSRLHTTRTGNNVIADPASELVLLQVPQPFSNHKGGQIAFGPDGMLYLGLGDGGSEGDPNGNGQDIKDNLLASILRIDVRKSAPGHPYDIPPDNPFAQSPGGAKPETWAYGLRNPWRFSFDLQTRQLWAGDVGQNAYEEVDLIEKGKNYGWSVMEGFHCYRPPSGCDQSGLTLPVVDYAHDGGGCAITGGFVYRGAAMPGLQGDYIFADYCTGEISAFPVAGARAGSRPTITVLRHQGARVLSFGRDGAGELYLLCDDGNIYRLGL